MIPDKELSEWENRYLASRPSITMAELSDGTFMTKYEDYIKKNISTPIKISEICKDLEVSKSTLENKIKKEKDKKQH